MKIKDLIVPLALDGTPLPALKNAFNIEITKELGGVDMLTFLLIDEVVNVEQNVIYGGRRYVVSTIEDLRADGKKYSRVECPAAYVEIGHTNIKTLNLATVVTQAGLEKILARTKWTVGVVEDTDHLQHSMNEENKSALWLVRQWAKITGYEVEFDAINRQINFYRQIGRETTIAFRYQKDIKEIKKTTFAPQATVIYPRGRGGLTIESLNNDQDYLEDYSWYESLGLPKEEARQRFRKEYVWEDERFIYPGTLLRAAQEKLRELSHPQIAYEASVINIGAEGLDIGDYAYVVDDELGIRVKVRVVRLNIFPGREWENKIELNYLIPGLEFVHEEGVGAGSGSDKDVMVLVKNTEPITADANYKLVNSMSLTAYAPTNTQVGLTIVGQASTQLTLEGYFEIAGRQVGVELKDTILQGWNTISITFILTQLQEGSHFLNFYLKTSTGTFSVEQEKSELYVIAKNLLGGLSATMPRAYVVEEVQFATIEIAEVNVVTHQVPVPAQVVEEVEYPAFEVDENFEISLEGAQ